MKRRPWEHEGGSLAVNDAGDDLEHVEAAAECAKQPHVHPALEALRADVEAGKRGGVARHGGVPARGPGLQLQRLQPHGGARQGGVYLV